MLCGGAASDYRYNYICCTVELQSLVTGAAKGARWSCKSPSLLLQRPTTAATKAAHQSCKGSGAASQGGGAAIVGRRRFHQWEVVLQGGAAVLPPGVDVLPTSGEVPRQTSSSCVGDASIGGHCCFHSRPLPLQLVCDIAARGGVTANRESTCCQRCCR
jgi:hypothetical protein